MQGGATMEVLRIPSSTQDSLAQGNAVRHGPLADETAPAPCYQPTRIPQADLNPNERVIRLLVLFTIYVAIPTIGIIGIITVGHALHSP